MKIKYTAMKYWDYEMSPLTKTEAMAKKFDDIINISIGNPDYPADTELLEETFLDVKENDITKYAGFFGDAELINETKKYYLETHKFKINSNELLITAGGTNALHIILEALLNPDDEVILITPYYPDYIGQIQMAGGKAIIYHTDPKENFDINEKDLEAKISNCTKLIIINSPNNPSGKVYSQENIKSIYKLAEKHDFLIIADDIYTALNYTNQKKAICTYEKNPNRIITIYSYSKDFTVPGLRIGHILGHHELIDVFCIVAETVDFTVNSISQRLAYYALRRRSRILEPLIDEYKKRVQYCYSRVQAIPNMFCSKPEGTFYVFINIEETGLTSFEIWDEILNKAHLVVLPGAAFGESCDSYIRIACTVGVDVLAKAFDRLESLDIFKG